MEVKINIGNRSWSVPSNMVQFLIEWLNTNAVELGTHRTEIKEIRADRNNDCRQLIME